MTRLLNVACIQLCAGQNVEKNIEIVDGYVRQAAKAGAQFIVTPEQTTLMELAGEDLFANIYLQGECPSLAHLTALAGELGVYLCIGSLAILNPDGSVANRGFLISPAGEILSRYDKIHMFDLKLRNGEEFKESATYTAGDTACFVRTDLFGFGHSICYDLRFPKLYNALANLGAEIIVVPAAFTVPTGEAHWHVLLRARAIETGSFVMAAAQGGLHENGRKTYGHSLIISPWGEVLAELANDADGLPPMGYIMAEIDLDKVTEMRGNIPTLKHERSFKL